MIVCAWGLVEGASRARNAAFWSYFGFFWIEDVLGGLVDVAWAVSGPWKQWCLAKHIAKPSKYQKQQSQALVCPSANSKIFCFSPIKLSQIFKLTSRA